MKTPEEELAIAVLMQAIKDAKKKTKNQNQNNALSFLKGKSKEWEDSFVLWCEFADINPQAFREKLSKQSWFKGEVK